MPNQIKHTQCNICGMNLEDLTYDKMNAHVQRHAAAHPDQTSMKEF